MQGGEHKVPLMVRTIPLATKQETKPSPRKPRRAGTPHTRNQSGCATRNLRCKRDRKLHEVAATQDLIRPAPAQAEELIGRLMEQEERSELMVTPRARAA